MSTTGLRSLIACLGVCAWGCTGTETGNPPQQGVVSLGLTAFSSAPETAALEAGQGGLVVDEVRLNVVGLHLVPCDGRAAPLGFAAGAANLLQGTSAESQGLLELCGVTLELAPALDASAGLPLGTALYLHGLRSDGSQFEVLSTAQRSFELHALEAKPFGELPLLLGFDLGVWFSAVDVHGAHAGADGIARLDETLNPSTLAAFEGRATLSAALYADADADGALDESERVPVAVP